MSTVSRVDDEGLRSLRARLVANRKRALENVAELDKQIAGVDALLVSPVTNQTDAFPPQAASPSAAGRRDK